MPQLDAYLICNLVYNIIILFILAYMLNISNILLILNLSIRTRKLKILIEKKYIYNLLKEVLNNSKLKYISLILLKNKIWLENFKKNIFILDLLDIVKSENKLFNI